MFYQQTGMSSFASMVTSHVMAGQTQSIFAALFVVFMCVLILLFIVLSCFVLSRVKQQFWHSFYILRLIPKDDVDKDFIKRINDYLSRA